MQSSTTQAPSASSHALTGHAATCCQPANLAEWPHTCTPSSPTISLPSPCPQPHPLSHKQPSTYPTSIPAHLRESRARARLPVARLRGHRCCSPRARILSETAEEIGPAPGSTSATTGWGSACSPRRYTHTQLPKVSSATWVWEGSARIACAAHGAVPWSLLCMSGDGGQRPVP